MAFRTFQAGNWHPLFWLSMNWMVNSMQSSRGPHLTNVVLHTLTAMVYSGI